MTEPLSYIEVAQRVYNFMPVALNLFERLNDLKNADSGSRLAKANDILSVLQQPQNKEALIQAIKDLNDIKQRIPEIQAFHRKKIERERSEQRIETAVGLLKLLQGAKIDHPPTGASVAQSMKIDASQQAQFVAEYDRVIQNIQRQHVSSQEQQNIFRAWLSQTYMGPVRNPWLGAFVVLVVFWVFRKFYEVFMNTRYNLARWIKPAQWHEFSFFGWKKRPHSSSHRPPRPLVLGWLPSADHRSSSSSSSSSSPSPSSPSSPSPSHRRHSHRHRRKYVTR